MSNCSIWTRNLSIFNKICWVTGTNNSSTKCLMFQALFILWKKLKPILQKVILWTSDTWLLSHLSQQTSEPAYHIADWSIYGRGSTRILKRHPFYPYFYRWWDIPRALCWHIFTAKMIFRNLQNSQVLHIYKKICVHTKVIKYLQEICCKRNSRALQIKSEF